jgi:hypothetical protein
MQAGREGCREGEREGGKEEGRQAGKERRGEGGKEGEGGNGRAIPKEGVLIMHHISMYAYSMRICS